MSLCMILLRLSTYVTVRCLCSLLVESTVKATMLRRNRVSRSLISMSLGLCLLNIAQAKPRQPALGIGLESGLAYHIAEEQNRPTIAFRGSFLFLETVKREIGKGLPISWFGVYGRLQSDFDDRLRTAVGLSTGYYFLHGELGWSKYTAKRSEHSGPELLLGLGVFDILGLYTRWAWLSNDHSIFELGLRLNYPLWVGGQQSTKRRPKRPKSKYRRRARLKNKGESHY